MQTTDKVEPPILANSTLKEKFLNDLVKKYNINEKFMKKNSKLFKTYADIKFELFLYSSIIPYEKLEYYRGLKTEETHFFIELHKLLNNK